MSDRTQVPGEEVVILELVHQPADGSVDVGTGFSHIVIQAENLSSTIQSLSKSGLRPGSMQRPGAAHEPQTPWLNDPDGYRVELVEWLAGHPDGITEADFD